MAYSEIRYEVENGVATITLNRPEKMNAMTWTQANELIDAFDKIDADDAVRVVIVTGAGRAFCAGADLSSGAESFDYDAKEGGVNSPVRPDGSINYDHDAVRDGGGLITLRIFKCLKPVIAAVNGAAVGAGATMQLAMDIRLASENAKYGFVFARRGIVPESASAWFLPRIVGIGRALEWCCTGRIFSASEALEAGLVRSLHAPEDLLPAANAIAREIADNTAPVSIALTRQMLWQGLVSNHPMDAHRIDSWAVYARGRTADAKEGVQSFLEKRPPNFPNKVSTEMPDFFPWWDEPRYERG
ncbi:MAG: crotonase/enoyl-CoA hydratase family protein [Hyphomonadaceae bacterium]